ncbi:MAG: glycosyltransferase [Phycisphaerales bacterium]
MRILHVLSVVRAEVGGPARAVTDLCAAFARRGHEVTLVTWDDTDVPAAWKKPAQGTSALRAASSGADSPGFTSSSNAHSSYARESAQRADVPRVITVPAPSLPGGLFTGSALAPLRDVIAQHDVLHLHGAWGPWNVQLGGAAKKVRVPYFVSIRGMLDDWCMTQKSLKKTLFLRLGGTRYYEQAASVHLTAQFEYEQAKKYFPRGRGTVIPNLLDMEPFKSLPGPEAARAKFAQLGAANPDHEPVLLFLSRIHVKKGIEHLLRAVRLLNDSGTPCRAIIAGSGDEPYVASLKALCTELRLDDRVSFVGLVTGDLKLSLYQACDLFVLPTSQENFGFVFPEALACETPVVTTKGVDIWPELESSGAARIVDNTAQATAEGVRAMLNAPGGRAGLKTVGAKGRAWVFDWLAPEKVMAQFERMYEAGRGRVRG